MATMDEMERKMAAKAEFKVGDRVQPRDPEGIYDPRGTRVITFVGKSVIVYDRTSLRGTTYEQTSSPSAFAEAFEVIPNFFEVNRTYKRFTSWSIAAQENNVTERFEVKQVERNGSGLLVAFGRLVVVQHADTWVLRDEWSWNNEKWEEER